MSAPLPAAVCRYAIQYLPSKNKSVLLKQTNGIRYAQLLYENLQHNYYDIFALESDKGINPQIVLLFSHLPACPFHLAAALNLLPKSKFLQYHPFRHIAEN